MNAAIFIADQFLSDDELIVYTQGKARDRQTFTSMPGGLCTDIDLAILVDENTASASEILAGAIQDNDRGLIIGRRSFGKGLVQEQRNLADGSAIRLTIARYYTPTGRSIQRAYNGNLSDYYYGDRNDRYLHGEMESADSNKFADSLKFVTPGGKTVYGGGGIMPDIFVPIDTLGISDYMIDVVNQGLLYRFALKYSDNHRDLFAGIDNYKDFVKVLNKQNILRQFIAFASKEGVKEVKSDINISGEILKVRLYANIARNFLDSNGYYPIVMEIDNTLLKAVDALSANADK